MNARFSFALLAVVLSSCLDLDLPAPKVGAVRGSLRSKAGPLVGATVVLTAEGGASSPVTTDAAGAFSANGLSTGLWSLNVTVTKFLPLEKVFTVSSGQTRDLGELTLYSEAIDPELAGTLRGTVHVDGTDGKLVQGGTIEALVQPGMGLIGTTALGASGLFALQLPPGKYTVRASHPSFVTAVIADITVASKAETALPDNALVLALNPGRVAGVVVKEVDGSNVTVPAPNVTIFSDTGASTITATDGAFTLGGLPGGARVLTFAATGLHVRTGALSVTVVPGETTAIADVGLALDRGDVIGTVEMVDASPLRDVTVFLDGTSYSALAAPSALEPAKGTFRIAQVPVGVYTLTAIRTGYRSVSSGTFTVKADEPVTVPALAKLIRIQGDFVIDDQDATNTPGFTRVRGVQLLVNNPTAVAEYRAAETDPAAAGLPFLPYGADGGTGIAFTLSPSEGEKTIFLQLRDNLGTLGPVLTASVVLDVTAPTDLALTLAGGAAFTSLSNPLPFSLSGSDPATVGTASSGVSFMRLSLSATVDASGNLGGPRLSYRRDDAFTRPTSGEGPVTLYAQLIDNAGNVSAPAWATTVVDVTAPTGTLSILRGSDATKDGYTNSALVVLQVSANPEPNAGTVRVRLANSVADLDTATPVPVAAGVGWFLDAASDGLKTVSYRFIDSAGNLSAPQTATITLDRVAPAPLLPATRLVGLASATPTNSTAGSLLATASDERELSPTAAVLLDVGGTLTQLPPTSTTTVTGTLPFTLPAVQGVSALHVRFKDAAGNISAATDLTVELDTQAPAGSFTLTGALADGTTSSAVTSATSVKIALSHLGADRVYFTTSALAACPAASASYLSLFDPSLQSYPLGVTSGTATVAGCLLDAAGNSVLMAPVSIAVDSTAPTGCTLQLTGTKVDGTTAPAGLTASASVTAATAGCSEPLVEIAVIESVTAIACTNTGAYAWRSISALSPLALSAVDGAKTVRGCVRDAARNVGALALATMTVDTTAPSGATVLINADAPYLNASQIVAGAFSLSLTGSASGATEWAVDVTTGATNFLSLPANNPRTYSLPVSTDGTQRIYARFRDALGNEAYASDTIIADTVAPTGSAPAVSPTGDPGFVNSPVVTVQFTTITGAATMQLAESAVSSPACTAALSTASSQATTSALTMVLNTTQGTHFVCAQFSDAAGNTSSVLSSSVVLDQTAPTRPVITTGDSYLQLAAGQSATVDIATASTDTNFKGYERLGGTATSWTAVTPTGTRFALPIQNDGSEEGYRNELRLRAVDRAGNASAESSVLITADTNAPEPAIVDRRWVDNGNLRSAVYWQKPDAGDIEHYELYYNVTPITPLSGAYANEGTSPIRVPANGDTMSTTLSGLVNGSSTYVQVIPVDRAGNRAPLDAGVIQMTSNTVSPNLVASFTVAGVSHSFTEQYFDGYLYVGGSYHTPVGIFQNCQGTPGDLKLMTYDLRRLVAPVQNGTINAVTSPVQVSSLTVSNTYLCSASTSEQMEIRVSPPFLFWSAGSTVRIFDISVRSAPVLKATLTVPASTHLPMMELLGDTLFLSTTGNNYSFKLSTLFDNNAATVPASPAADNGTVAAGVTGFGASFATRNVLVNGDYNGFQPWVDIRLDDALDSNAGTVWSVGDVLFNQAYPSAPPPYLQFISKSAVSGNYGYFTNFTTSQVQILPLAPFWAGTVAASSGLISVGGVSSSLRYSVDGDQLLVPDALTGAFRIYDARDLTVSAPLLTSYDLSAPNPSHVVTFGNYAAVLANGNNFSAGQVPSISVFELATPRGFSVENVVSSSSYGRPEVRPGFVVIPGRPTVFDLHAGSTPTAVSDGVYVNFCTTGSAHFDDIEVQAYGSNLRVIDFESMLDRNPATTMGASIGGCTAPPSNDYCVAHPSAARITDVAAYGNYLVVVEFRGNQSVWLEVYDARPLRDHLVATSLSLAAPLASLQVYNAPFADPARNASLTLSQGYAVVSYQENLAFSINGGRVFAVDLRSAFDDNAATSLSASSVQANFAMPFAPDGGGAIPRTATLSLDTLYVASTRGVWAIPAAAVTDPDPLTVADGTGSVSAFVGFAFDDLQVTGSTVIAAPGLFSNFGQGQALVAFDTSPGPTTLNPVGYFSLAGSTTTSCSPPGDPSSRYQRTGLAVAGSKVYLQPISNNSPKLYILELE